MRSLISIIVLLSAVFLGATPAGFNFPAEDIKALGLKFEPVQVKIPGLKRSYRFLWLSDLHVMAQDVSEIEEKWQPAMIYRRDRRFNKRCKSHSACGGIQKNNHTFYLFARKSRFFALASGQKRHFRTEKNLPADRRTP